MDDPKTEFDRRLSERIAALAEAQGLTVADFLARARERQAARRAAVEAKGFGA